MNIHIYPHSAATAHASQATELLREAQAAGLGKDKRNYTVLENCIQYVNNNSFSPLFFSDEKCWQAVTFNMSWLGTDYTELAKLPLLIIQDTQWVCYQILILQSSDNYLPPQKKYWNVKDTQTASTWAG